MSVRDDRTGRVSARSVSGYVLKKFTIHYLNLTRDSYPPSVGAASSTSHRLPQTFWPILYSSRTLVEFLSEEYSRYVDCRRQ